MRYTTVLRLAFVMLVAGGGTAMASTPRASLASASCHDLQAMAEAIPGNGPMLLASYPSVRVNGEETLRALANVAYVYDNAAAGIALTACGAPRQARRIADALLAAAGHDPTYKDGRLRNAYQAGAVPADGVKLAGYWSDRHGQWMQDAYQVSTATGNAAWAALLLLQVYQDSHDPRYLDAATAQLRWIDAHTRNARQPAGYEGGVFGFDKQQQAQHWKSTEQNLDVYAAATWALRYRPDQALRQQARLAGAFVHTLWDPTERRFQIGTKDDGSTIARANSGLDAQVWPLLAFTDPATRKQWSSVWRWTDAHHGSGAGYGYRRDPEGIWTEGTAQAADAMQATGRPVPDALWSLLQRQRAPGGLFFATPGERLQTDLAIGPTSTKADFYYYHLPHLGATAWIALASHGWNPFAGRPLPKESMP